MGRWRGRWAMGCRDLSCHVRPANENVITVGIVMDRSALD
jgi:hypothetical protein